MLGRPVRRTARGCCGCGWTVPHATSGLLAGGFPRRGLEASGYIAIYGDIAGLLAAYAASPLAVAPAAA